MLFAALALMAGPPSDARAAGGAFVVDDATITDPGTCQVESWVSASSNHDFNAVSQPICTVGFSQPVEIQTTFQRQRSAGSWQSTFLLQAKVNPVPVGVGKAGVAVSGFVALDLLTNEFSGAMVNVPVTYTFSDDLRLNTNLGYVFMREGSVQSAFWGASVEHDLSKQWTVIAEIFGETGRKPDDPISTIQPRFQAGLRYSPNDTVNLDLIYGRNVTGTGGHWATLGLTVQFGKDDKNGTDAKTDQKGR